MPVTPSASDTAFGEWFRQQIAKAFLVERSEWVDGVQIWVGQRARRYLPIRDRRRALQAYLAERGRGS